MPYKDPEKTRVVVRSWKKDHPERVMEQARRRRAVHREEVRTYFRSWRKANLEKVATCGRAWAKNHPEVMAMKSAIRHMLKSGGFRKFFRSCWYVGCTPEFLRLYLERRFSPGMTWDNYGRWHIDHIRPLADFDFKVRPEDLFVASHYTNLQPMWAEENMSKGAKYQMETVA